MRKYCVLLVCSLFIATAIEAQVRMPGIFADNMVLQRNVLIPVWGWAKPNEKVEIQFNKQVKFARADKTGKWTVNLDAESAGGPYELLVKGTNTIRLENVLVGEVWLCSGQSNMEWTVGQSDNAKAEISSANYPFIRHTKVAHEISSSPETDITPVEWIVCDSASVADFSGIGYFFARNLYDKLKIPVGLINNSWGGTNIETWISRGAFENSDEFKEMIAGMPRVNLDSLSKLKVAFVSERIEKLQGSPISSDQSRFYHEPGFNDSNWPELQQPGLWESQSLGEFDGVVWLRKTIVLPQSLINLCTTLELAKIDDNDITYVNGVKVGNMDQWDGKRKYSIPPGILKAGENVVAVRVVDNGGGGGIYGDSAELKLNLGENSIPLSGNWKFQVESIKKTTDENSFPSLCYNAMVNPLIPFAFQGVLWYQGESNAGRAYQYRKAFPLLIKDWRQKWNNPAMPFYFAQLASFYTDDDSNKGSGWAELREAQTMTLSLPNTGMCVTTDVVVNPHDIHPTNKQDVGKRFAALALNNVYKIEMACNGPSFKSMEINENQVIVSFNNVGIGLSTPDKYGYIRGFEVAGKDQVFHYARAYIKGNTVVLYSENVENPVAVHYSWIGDASESNLFNKEGFPATPFRTDEWKTITLNEKYKIEKLK